MAPQTQKSDFARFANSSFGKCLGFNLRVPQMFGTCQSVYVCVHVYVPLIKRFMLLLTQRMPLINKNMQLITEKLHQLTEDEINRRKNINYQINAMS